VRFLRAFFGWVFHDRFWAAAVVLSVAAVASLIVGSYRAIAGPSGSEAVGTVTEVIEYQVGSEGGGTAYDTIISYGVGGARVFRSKAGDSETSVGDTVTVYFDPDDPAGTNATDADRSLSISSYLFSALILGAGAWLFSVRSSRGRWPWDRLGSPSG
jgi:hypothetical protein